MPQTQLEMGNALETGQKPVTGQPEIETPAKRGMPKGSTRVFIVSKAPLALLEVRKGTTIVKVPFCVKVMGHVAQHLGMEESDIQDAWYETAVGASGGSPATEMTVRIRGSQRAKFISVPYKEGTTWKETEKGHYRWLRIPVPGNANILNIAAFLQDTIKSNHPGGFRSPDGVFYPLKKTA